MNALLLILMMLAVAMLSSAITCAAIFVYYRRVLEPEFERNVQEAVEAVGEEVGRQVRVAVVEGVTDLAKGDVVVRTTEKVATTGANVLTEGLNVIFGPPRNRNR